MWRTWSGAYTFTTYMQTFVKLSSGLSEDQTTFVMFGSLIFATLLQPLYGALSDRIGRKPLLIFFGIAGSLSTIPILTTLLPSSPRSRRQNPPPTSIASPHGRASTTNGRGWRRAIC